MHVCTHFSGEGLSIVDRTTYNFDEPFHTYPRHVVLIKSGHASSFLIDLPIRSKLSNPNYQHRFDPLHADKQFRDRAPRVMTTNSIVQLRSLDVSWLEGKGLLLLHKAILKDARLKDQHEVDLFNMGIRISGDVDFGIHNLMTTGAAVPRDLATMSPLFKVLTEQCFVRNIVVQNTGR